MGFIDNNEPTTLNIKLTTKGRELLSRGELDFKYFIIGDSEVNYKIINNGVEVNNMKILAPLDKTPNILSQVPKTDGGEIFNIIPNVPSMEHEITNNLKSFGFFNITSGGTSFINDESYIKQSDIYINTTELSVVDRKVLTIRQSSTYLANVNEPAVGDYILVKWAMNENTYETNVIDESSPYLIYKIVEIVAGSLNSNDLEVKLDRDLPIYVDNYDVGAYILYGTYINPSSISYVSDSVLSFITNSDCDGIAYPFWNFNIIYIDNVIGIQDYNMEYYSSNSINYAGFVSYIQNQKPIYDKLGVIHYSNNSPFNTLGEEFYKDTCAIDIPTVMWHKSKTKKMGLRLSASGNVKTITGDTKSLNIKYYDLVDENNNIVGKVFNELKLFVIEDQELLFAMSYKSNRNWTLPKHNISLNTSIAPSSNCILTLKYDITKADNGMDGKIRIYDIAMSDIINGSVIFKLNSGEYIKTYTGGTEDIVFENLSAGSYTLTAYDLGAPNCIREYKFEVETASQPFIFTIDTSTDPKFTLPLVSGSYNYNFIVDWGDGNQNVITSYNDPNNTHIYGDGNDTHQISIMGICETIRFENSLDSTKLIGIDKWGETGFINMKGAFKDCINLTYVSDNANAIWSRDVVDMSNMFNHCNKLTTLNIGSWNVFKVQNMSNMFYNCAGLVTLDVSGWNTSNVDNMSGMFFNCNKITTLNVGSWNTSNVTDTSNMFFNCNKITTLNVGSWNTGNVIDMSGMFKQCTSITTLNLNSWNTINVENISSMFLRCSNLSTLSLDAWNTIDVSNMASVFMRCGSLKNLNLSGWTMGSVTNVTNMFNKTPLTIESYDNILNNWASQSLTPNLSLNADLSKYSCLANDSHNYITNTFNWAIVDAGLNVASCDETVLTPLIFRINTEMGPTGINKMFKLPLEDNHSAYDFIVDWGDNKQSIINHISQPEATHTYDNHGIYDISISGKCTNIKFSESIDRTKLISIIQWGDTGLVDMENAFRGCSNLESSIDTDGEWCKNVTNMYSMFRDCTSLTDINVTNWDTGNVTSLSRMFYNCSQGYTFTIDVGEWNISNVNGAMEMFHNVNLDSVSYSNLLIGWESQTVKQGVVLGANLARYSCNANDSHNRLVNNKGWLITDLGVIGNCEEVESFIFTINTVLGNGIANFKLPTQYFGQGFNINWGDGESNTVTTQTEITHQYSQHGIYEISLNGVITDIGFNNTIDKSKIIKVNQWGSTGLLNMENAFHGCENLTSVDDSDGSWCSGVTYMSNMFKDCTSLNNIDVSNWMTNNVRYMDGLFNNCTSLTTLNVDNWNVGNVLDMSHMFQSCNLLNGLNISNWNVGNVSMMTDILKDVPISTVNYNNLLVNWSNLPTLQWSVEFNANLAKYSAGAATTARNLLENTYFWDIIDGGQI